MKEIQIQRAIKDYLQILENQGKLMFIRNNTGAMPIEAKKGKKQYFMGVPISDGETKRRYVRFGKKGSPDLLVWLPSVEWDDLAYRDVNVVRAIALEVKSEKAKQSESQKEWQDKFEKLGGEYYIIRSVDDVMEIIE